MAAPKSPNVAAAHAARRAQGDLTASNRLVGAGYLVMKPEELAKLPEDLQAKLLIALTALDIRAPKTLVDTGMSMLPKT